METADNLFMNNRSNSEGTGSTGDRTYEYNSPGGNPFAGTNNPFTSGGNPFGGGSGGSGGPPFGNPLAPAEGYEYDFASSELPVRTPFDPLFELPGIDGFEDLFGDMGANPFAGGASTADGEPENGSGGNPFAGGIPSGGGNPFAGGMPATPAEGDDPDTSNPFANWNPLTDGNPFTDSDDGEDMPSDSSIPTSGNWDFGTGNTPSGNGNWYLGDDEGSRGSNNTTSGNGNWYFGNANQTEGNGNWNFGDGNQTQGNGNWYLSGEGNPFNNLFAGDSNPLTSGGGGDNPFANGNIPTNGIGGNNPVFAGGSQTPAVLGEDDEMPVTAADPDGNTNVTTGNGNWYFGSDNATNGNGNWYFGRGNTTNGNGNWNLGDNNRVQGNGNRPTGDDNLITGNGNRPSGSGNTMMGNRFSLDEDNLTVYGNGDRYFIQHEDRTISLVSDDSARDPQYTFDYDELTSMATEADSETANGQPDGTTGINSDLVEAIAGTWLTGTSNIGSDTPFPGRNQIAPLLGGDATSGFGQ